MVSIDPEQFLVRSLIYHGLAEALYEPVSGLQDSLLQATTAGAHVLGSSACSKATLSLVECPTVAISELRKRYAQAIAPPHRRPLALYESLHREGRLMGQTARATEQRYRALEITPDRGELPDHASVELSFLGHLTTAEAQAHTAVNHLLVTRLRIEERSFLRDHAGAWLPEMGSDLAQASDPFYAAVGSLLSEFLTEELTHGWYRATKAVSSPVLTDDSACNLCGLCTGVCRTGALRVVENDCETVLALDISRCVGCERCIRTCPQELLVQSATDEDHAHGEANSVSSVHILRRAPRAQCPVCGCPTVSQAELAAVFATLQPDPVMQQQMSLCVKCKSLWNSW